MKTPENPLDAALTRIERQARNVWPITTTRSEGAPLSEEEQRRRKEAFGRARRRLEAQQRDA